MAVTEQLREFIKDVRLELSKVSWPTWPELWDSTVVVIVTCLLITVFVAIVDRILTLGVGLLFR
jgi:preprotein translocase subunit SecE